VDGGGGNGGGGGCSTAGGGGGGASNVRFVVLTAELLKIPFFWDVTLCRWVNSFRRFEGCYCLRSQRHAVQE
jgi:hypothetical protein